MPVVAAVLFEFCLRELRLRTLAHRADRKLSALRWLHPAERIRVQLCMAADEQLMAEAATRHVRLNHAARRLYQLRAALSTHHPSATPGPIATRRVRWAEHRAHRALTRAGFTDPAIAAAVLRQVQVLTMTATLARLDYRTADAAQAAIANLIASPAARPEPEADVRPEQPAAQDRMPANQVNGHPPDSQENGQPEDVSAARDRDAPLISAATRIVTDAMRDGGRLSQAALAGKLRSEGYTVANNRLRWLSSVSGLEPRHAAAPDTQPRWRPVMARRGPVTFEDQRKQEEDRERRLADLRIRLQEAALEVRTPGDWIRCLRAAARLPGENWANILPIASRKPGATLVKGYEAWRTSGRQVNRDEQGIEIFSHARQQEPNRRDPGDDGQDPSWRDAHRVAYVWDLSQTSGRPLPAQAAIPSPPGDVPPGLWDCLCWLARREGYAVERENGCPDDGATLWAARRIRILPGLTSDQAIWALAHQLGHVLLPNTIAYPPGTTTSGCQGVQKAEADSVAFIICTRHGVPIEHTFSSPQTWAGSDPRAQPAAAILATGERITAAATRISRLLDRNQPGIGLAALAGTEATALTSHDQDKTPRAAPRITAPAATPAPSPEPDPRILGVLIDAEEFYISQLAGSWAPAYLRKRGLTEAAIGKWHIGYAPRGWTALTEYLRGRGHADDAIQAAGLARTSSRGTLIDHFRDRVMLPVHDDHGKLAGFTGRARPGTGPAVPKYLNSPETSTYKKGNLLFGLHHARRHLAHGATPVIVEGPFGAIAATLADPGHYAGLAPCGTALTSRQAAALSRAADLRQTGILVAFDDDTAGRKAAVRAYDILRPISDRLQSATLSGRDPAEILEAQGATALRAILQDHVQPLSAAVIDAHIDPWERRLRDTEGPLLAMRSVATVIASLLPAEAAGAIRQITGNEQMATVDENMRPVANPELPEIARALPADTAYQITRAAERLGSTDYSDVLAEVTNAVIRNDASPKGGPHDAAARLARSSFPHPPLTIHASAEPATAPLGRPGNRPKLARMKRPPSS